MEPESESRSNILQTALRLFSRLGYESTSVTAIVGEVGLTKPALYYHFGSKHSLLEAIVAAYGIPLLDIVQQAARYNHDLVMNLTGLFKETVDFAALNPDYFRLLVSLYSAAPETSGYGAGNGIRKRLVTIIEQLFENAAEDHGNMKNRQRIYAETFFGLIQTWALLVINGEMILSDNDRYRIVHQYMHGIFS